MVKSSLPAVKVSNFFSLTGHRNGIFLSGWMVTDRLPNFVPMIMCSCKYLYGVCVARRKKKLAVLGKNL